MHVQIALCDDAHERKNLVKKARALPGADVIVHQTRPCMARPLRGTSLLGASRPVINDRASCTLKRHRDNARPVGSVYPIEQFTCISARQPALAKFLRRLIERPPYVIVALRLV